MMPEQHQQQRERCRALSEQTLSEQTLSEQTGSVERNDALSRRRQNYRLRRDMETDEERQSRPANFQALTFLYTIPIIMLVILHSFLLSLPL